MLFRFVRSVYAQWGSAVTGTASAPLFLYVLLVAPSGVPRIATTVFAIVCLYIAAYQVWKREHLARAAETVTLTGHVIEAYLDSCMSAVGEPGIIDTYLVLKLYIVNEGRPETTIQRFECALTLEGQSTLHEPAMSSGRATLEPFMLEVAPLVLPHGEFQAKRLPTNEHLNDLCLENHNSLRFSNHREGWLRFVFRGKSEAEIERATITVYVIDARDRQHATNPCGWPWPRPNKLRRK